MAEGQIGHRKSQLVLSARFSVVNRRSRQSLPLLVSNLNLHVLRSMHNEQWSLDHNISIFGQIEESSTDLTEKGICIECKKKGEVK